MHICSYQTSAITLKNEEGKMRKGLILILTAAVFLGAAGMATASTINLVDTTTFTATGTNASEDYVAHNWGL